MFGQFIATITNKLPEMLSRLHKTAHQPESALTFTPCAEIYSVITR